MRLHIRPRMLVSFLSEKLAQRMSSSNTAIAYKSPGHSLLIFSFFQSSDSSSDLCMSFKPISFQVVVIQLGMAASPSEATINMLLLVLSTLLRKARQELVHKYINHFLCFCTRYRN